MWYGGANIDGPELAKIGFAFSADGVIWTQLPASTSPFFEAGFVLQAGYTGPGDNGVTSDPVVLKENIIFHMWYNNWVSGGVILISQAISSDSIKWPRSPRVPVLRYTPGTWEVVGLGLLQGNVAQCTVLWDEDSSRFWMWYGSFDNSGELAYEGTGFCTFADGITWYIFQEAVFKPSPSCPGEQRGVLPSPTVILRGLLLHVHYGGITLDGRIVTNHAMARLEDARRAVTTKMPK